ncbi:HAD family hydrolase [Primorskyibacter flagellatus]|uniref:Phosphoglycolate phosphatase n=1 Tax=Primorskyibacter flagellatus TaxID=1387277 RepID=A0A1W2ETP9_9RHOB|nr:HAD family hydrolase [Primorskyibacter flagellatus]SMD12952.1 phosphoglycolate phosphatase [Primorskyibacter flagellatus]
MTSRKAVRLLICDLDNTLYDWVGYFVVSFYEMVDTIVDISDCDRETLLDDFRKVHRKHHDSEHPFALLETETIRRLHPKATFQEIAEIYDPAFHAFNSSRKRNLALYPGVMNAIQAVHASGITLVAHTESKLFSATDRIQRLQLNQYFSKLYCREASEALHPAAGSYSVQQNHFPPERIIELSHHQRKPNVQVVREICNMEGVPVSEAAYVGDSIAKDVMMSNDAGLFSIWAKYGSNNSKADYKKLVRISHWSDEDVVREQLLTRKAKDARPNAVLYKSFNEIFRHIKAHKALVPVTL